MKIETTEKDKRTSAEIYYHPSQYFQMVAEEFAFDEKEENGKSVYEEMTRTMSIFTDMMEIVNMHWYSSAICFNKALEGLISGMAADIATNYYDDYKEKMPLEELLTKLKTWIYKDKEYIVKNNFFMEEERPDLKEKKPKTFKVIKLKKSLE